MKALLNTLLRLLLAATAVTAADYASARQVAADDSCSLYGFARGTRDYAECRMNARYYWSAGPCTDRRFAWTHRRYCHLYQPLDF